MGAAGVGEVEGVGGEGLGEGFVQGAGFGVEEGGRLRESWIMGEG